MVDVLFEAIAFIATCVADMVILVYCIDWQILVPFAILSILLNIRLGVKIANKMK